MKISPSDRQKIIDLVRETIRRGEADRFIPGQTPVHCAGRVYDEEEVVNLVDASLDFWLTSGRYAEKFEKLFAARLGRRYCVLVNSGSSANLLAVSALTSPLLERRRLLPGDEVITIASGFPTTLNPIIQNNLVPVFVDVELGTYNIRGDRVADAVGPRTKAIFIPHTLGNPADIDAITAVVEKHGLWFIEDNCDALDSLHQSKQTGTFGHLATCSFYPAHHITMGEGGAVLADDEQLKQILVSFRDWGRACWCDTGCDNTCGRRFDWKIGDLPFGYDHKYVYSHIGYNLKATEMQAAIGVAQLEKLSSFTVVRKNNFRKMLEFFREYEEFFILPRPAANSEPSWFGFPLSVKAEAPFARADIVTHLENHKIATRMLFGGNLLKQPAYRDVQYRVSGSLENTDFVMNNLFWIGVYPGITEERLLYVFDVVRDFMKKYTP